MRRPVVLPDKAWSAQTKATVAEIHRLLAEIEDKVDSEGGLTQQQVRARVELLT